MTVLMGLLGIAALLCLLTYLNRNDINVEPPRPRGIWRETE